MRAVEISPMPESIAALPARLRPIPPPIFPGATADYPPTAEEVALAKALFLELDPESQHWYCSPMFAGLVPARVTRKRGRKSAG